MRPPRSGSARHLLWHLSASTALIIALPAGAQVSVPLPGRGGAPRLPSAPASDPLQPAPAQSGTSVPLPGSTPETPPLSVPMGPYGRPDINPYDRDIELTAPLTYRDKPLGEVPVLLTRDDRFLIDTAPFLDLIDTLLNDKAKSEIKAALVGHERFENEDLKATGVSLEFDPGSLSVVVLKIDAAHRATMALFDTPRPDDEKPDVKPAGFSAYVNIDAVESRIWGDVPNNGFRRPSFFVTGAARVAGVVLETDVQLAEKSDLLGGNGYRFDRNYARFVYDEAEDYRRWYLGDLTPEIRGQQGYVQMGGFGVSRQRQRFDQFRSAILQGNRQLLLQRDATVDVYRNGTLLKQFKLQAGSYDLSSLPLLSGSNDVQVQVRDSTGLVQDIAYRSYLDPIDLQPGDYEYSGYIGRTSNRFGRTPVYNGPVAFSGFYRKAFVGKPAIGIGLQASKRTQVFTGQTQFILSGGSRLQFDMGVSNTKAYGVGYAPGVTYERIFDRGGLIDSFTLHADYMSRRFGSLGNDLPDNSSAVSVDAQYTRAMSQKLTLLFNGSYIRNRGSFGDNYRLNTLASYRMNRKWSVRGGVNYTHYGSGFGNANGMGFNVSLVFEPSYRDRAEVSYDKLGSTATASYSHMSDGTIGSIGYGALATRSDGSANGQAYVDYIDSKFDASLIHSAYGRNFGNVTDQQVTSLRVGTALAFADGSFGVGRRIGDSFAILTPHQSLKGHDVVAGQSIAENAYLTRSGPLGGAVNSYLSSYVTQSVQYDVENPPPGYDIGAGVFRVRPPYRSGYAMEIGADAFASAMGTMLYPDGKPVSLMGGKVVPVDRGNGEPVPFFTNSVGRFAIQNLRPGASYRIMLVDSTSSLFFTVPKDTKGLVDLKTVTVTDEGANK
ncbi:fimbria/pilus outer membrane usher protein [Sphingobium fuliginis]|uniref:P pilus assembly protein n=1 Tax=Sphingobium fuliginis (strain ATCC 27551) TaxID=336203 RepID=A0A292ZDT9_SPHSA|nr:fimbria/pilus outer membrane usher protein [Sphingobium fuliginis]GAY20993.1 P pilus assembly protein [Sphingobium fuliginis]